MLTLYYKPTCPFCQKVLAVSDELGIEFDLADITEGQDVVDELLEKGGKKQVPYLVDTDRGKAMYESDDIIAYLKEYYASTASGEQKKPKVHISDATCVACEG